MITIKEKATFSVHLSSIDMGDRSFRFRFDDPVRDSIIQNDIERYWQLYPITMVEKSPHRYSILDGFSRVRAFHRMNQKMGVHREIMANVIPRSDLTQEQEFKQLCQTNMHGVYSYGVYEKALFFSSYFKKGMSVWHMSQLSGVGIHDVSDFIDLVHAPAKFSLLINDAPLTAGQALLVLGRYRNGLGFVNPSTLDHILQKFIDQLKDAPPSLSTFRFHLNFFWERNRPFLVQ